MFPAAPLSRAPPAIWQATQPGDRLLDGKICSLCSSETGGLGKAATEFLHMLDVHQSRGTSGGIKIAGFSFFAVRSGWVSLLKTSLEIGFEVAIISLEK